MQLKPSYLQLVHIKSTRKTFIKQPVTATFHRYLLLIKRNGKFSKRTVRVLVNERVFWKAIQHI